MPMDPTPSRREMLAAAGGLASLSVVSTVTARPAGATPATMNAAIRRVVGEAKVQAGKVKIDVPPLVENGNTVPVTVHVDMPITEQSFVRAIHIFNEKNPQPNVGSFKLGPRAGRASVSTRMRLADSQNVVAIAHLSDDTFWSDKVEVIVTLAACVEEM